MPLLLQDQIAFKSIKNHGTTLRITNLMLRTVTENKYNVGSLCRRVNPRQEKKYDGGCLENRRGLMENTAIEKGGKCPS